MASEAIAVPINAPRCLVASAEGDDHTLGLSLAEICLREAGWRVEWAGRSTRPADICERVKKGAIQMVAVSASLLMDDRKRLRTQVRDVGRCCQRAGIALVLGGAGAWPDPPEFGQRLQRWEDFNALLRDHV
jgi:methylmalonyl-CoA mutase cobalamin-binding subunit